MFSLSQPFSIIMNRESTASLMLLTKTQNKPMHGKKMVSMNIFLLEFWEQTFGCRWIPNETSQLCTGSENLETADTLLTDVSRLRVSYNTYMAVYAIAKAVHNLHYCMQMKGILLNVTCGDISSLEPWQVRMLYHKTFLFLLYRCEYRG